MGTKIQSCFLKEQALLNFQFGLKLELIACFVKTNAKWCFLFDTQHIEHCQHINMSSLIFPLRPLENNIIMCLRILYFFKLLSAIYMLNFMSNYGKYHGILVVLVFFI